MNIMKNMVRILEIKCNGVVIPLRGKVILLILGLSAIFSGALVPRSAWCLDADQRKAFIASLPQGETFDNDGSTYVWLPTLQAENTKYRKAESSLKENDGSASAEAAVEEVVERKGPFTVYKRFFPAEPMIRSAELFRDVKTYPVALNLRTESFAVITGNISLKLKEIKDAQSMADSHGITLSFVNEHMSTAFYEMPADANIPALREDLENDSRVLRVTLDMVDRLRRPH